MDENFTDARLAFYTGNNKPLLELQPEENSSVWFLKQLALISEGKNAEQKGNAALNAYAKFVSSGRKDTSALTSLDPSSSEQAALLTALGLYLDGQADKALETLELHKNINPDALVLRVRILLSQNKLEGAQRLLRACSASLNEDAAHQLASGIVDMSASDEDNVRSAYHIFEDLSAMHRESSSMILGQAVTEIQLGRIDEAKDTLTKLDDVAPKDPNGLVAKIVVGLSEGDDVSDLQEELKKVDATHPLFKELKEKNDLFDKVVAKYADKVVS